MEIVGGDDDAVISWFWFVSIVGLSFDISKYKDFSSKQEIA
jgi:hypothetical protein